jgi:hypothetical protein
MVFGQGGSSLAGDQRINPADGPLTTTMPSKIGERFSHLCE